MHVFFCLSVALPQDVDALMSIEGFRSLNEDIQTIINKSEHVKKAKSEKEELTPKEKKQLTDEEKEYKSKRKMIQEKLIKFATRVPVFMYLTDYREYSLQDVITQFEPELFRKVTGLKVKDFELLVSLNVFNESLMNDAVYKFKRYEDASLTYTGVDRHKGENIGLYSTVVSKEEYDAMAGLLNDSMEAPLVDIHDLPDRPVFVNQFAPDEEEEEPEIIPIRRLEPTAKAAEGPIVPFQPITPTYRPAFVPPKATTPATKPAPAPQMDLSGVRRGSIVIHKAFGEGTVIKIENGKTGQAYIHVVFDKTERSFGFPGAFYDGYLRAKE